MDVDESSNFDEEEWIMDDQIILKVGIKIVVLFKLTLQVPMHLKTKEKRVPRLRYNMLNTIAEIRLKFVDEVILTVSDHMNVDGMTLGMVGGIGSLVSQMEMELATTQA